MKVFNLPTVTGIFDALQFGYFNLRTRPVFHAAVCSSNPKHFDQSIAFEPNNTPRVGNLDFRDRLQPCFLRVDLPISFQARQKMPAQTAHQLQVLNGGIPAIETKHLWSKAAFVRLQYHLREMIVLCFSVRIFIKNTIITRSCPIAVCPEQAYQVDARDNFFVFARPAPVNQVVAFGKRFIKRRIVQRQNAVAQVNLRPGFLPECSRVWFESLQKARKSIVSRHLCAFRLNPSRFSRRHLTRRGNHKVNIIFVRTFGRIHSLVLSNICSTA